MNENGLCPNCVNSVRCYTWAERRCLKRALRFTSYGHSQPTECSDYKARDKNYKEPRCQCDDCLRNEAIIEELEEEGAV